ncbi:MAG TPA: hypothetical protein PKC76_10675 [Saprospiraceae bacterium]|nr:hypothetical protein [Saprospiraceae bacterium]HMP24588.1 hypothetical protein [Saprospiraceae bacterium]
MLITEVKAGPVTNLTDARYFAAREVTWLSFDCRAGSDAHLPPATIHAIREWVGGVQYLGEFDLSTAADIQELMDALQFDAIQVGPLTGPEVLVNLKATVPIFKEIVVEPETAQAAVHHQLVLFQPLVQGFVLDFAKNKLPFPTGGPLPLAQIAAWCREFPIFINADWHKETLKTTLEALQPQGLCVKGGAEEKVGYKSFAEMDEIFDLLEAPEQF